MFILSGTINGVTYEEKEMGADEISRLFGLNIPFESKKGVMAFELHPDQKKPDRLNGGYAYQSGRMLRTEIVGSYNGSDIQIQYYRQKNRRRENGVNITRYSPHHMLYDGDSFAFSLDRKDHPQDIEPLVFFWLSTKCYDSPIVGRTNSRYYRINDSLGKAKTLLARRTRMYEVYNQVMNPDFDMHLLRNKAAGMSIPEHTMEDEEVRAALLVRAENNPEAFWQAFDTQRTSFEGLVQRGLELGVVVSKSLGGGVQAYGFNNTISARDHGVPFMELCQFMAGTDGRGALKKALSGNLGLTQELNKHVEEHGMDQKVSTAFKDMDFGSTKKQATVEEVKDEVEDEYTEAAQWAVKNNLVSLKGDKVSVKHDTKTIYSIGTLDAIDEPLAPQVAFLLSQEENKKAMASILAKMKS